MEINSSITSFVTFFKITLTELQSFITFITQNQYKIVELHQVQVVAEGYRVTVSVPNEEVISLRKKFEIWNNTNHPLLSILTNPLTETLRATSGKYKALVKIRSWYFQIGEEQDDALSAFELCTIFEKENQPVSVFNDQGKEITRST